MSEVSSEWRPRIRRSVEDFLAHVACACMRGSDYDLWTVEDPQGPESYNKLSHGFVPREGKKHPTVGASRIGFTPIFGVLHSEVRTYVAIG